jgi:hypothetical protein
MQNPPNKSRFFDSKQVDISLFRSSSTQTSITPSFNNDRCIYTPSFTLPVDNVIHPINSEILPIKCSVLEMPIRRKDSKKSPGNLQLFHSSIRISAHGCGSSFKILPDLPRKVWRILRPHHSQNTYNQNGQIRCQLKDPTTLWWISDYSIWIDDKGQNQEYQEIAKKIVEKSKRSQK